MKICVLFPLCLVISLTGVVAEPDNEVKRGIFPFMGFVFYQDASVLDESGNRFRRSAILIRPSWLISAALERNDAPLAFPLKTLIARLGSINIDANFSFNEDEEEQEREVIQIVQPYNFNSTQWWFYDISVLKTLIPFNMSAVIAPISPHYKQDIKERVCKILVYTRGLNISEDRILMQLSVELLSPSTDCGIHFQADTMICGADSDENKNFNYETDYCPGNDGGPLLCEGEVTGLQTYVNENCRQPHLFQYLSSWEKFVNCGVEERCFEEPCNTTCTTINKDTPINEIIVATSGETTVMLVSQSSTEYSTTSTSPSSNSENTQVTDKVPEESDTTPPTLTTMEEELVTITTLTENTMVKRLDEDQSTPLIAGKIKEKPKSFDQPDDNMERKTNVEAQQQMVITKSLSVGNNIQLSRNLFLSFFLITIVTQ